MTASKAERTDTLYHILSWTPQILWALLAAGILLALLVGLWRKRIVWVLMWLPYLMIAAAVALQVEAFKSNKVEYAALKYVLRDPFFVETATPSLWALPALGFLHVVVVLYLSLSHYRREPIGY